MRFYWLMLGILCVWRVTHLLNAEDGPWDIVVRLRRRAGHRGWGDLLDCFYCLSLWVAVPFALLVGEDWIERLLLWPAFSAGAIVLEKVCDYGPPSPPPSNSESEENADGMLREEESGRTK